MHLTHSDGVFTEIQSVAVRMVDVGNFHGRAEIDISLLQISKRAERRPILGVGVVRGPIHFRTVRPHIEIVVVVRKVHVHGGHQLLLVG